MAGNICKLLAMAALLSTTHSQAGNVLFEIGTKDNSAAEFALYPGKYKNFLMGFSGVKHFAVGYSRPSSNWPYVLPGPKDNWGGGGYWAGYHPRHFPIINFQLAHAKAEGNCQLAFYFAGISAKESPVLRVEINGHRLEKKLKGTSTDQLLTGKESAIPSEWIIDFPAAWLKKGMNQIQLGLVKGKWCMFDCIRLTGTGDEAVQPISSSLITSVEAAGFEYKQEDGTRFQPVMVDMVQYDHPRTLTFTCGTVKEKRLIETGSSIQQILLPSVRKATEEVFTIHDGNQLVYQGTVRLAPKPLHTYADDVDLLMGTGNSRWMYKPSISLPLGMVQIAPDNEDETWKAGYEYTIENISGFNHFCDWTIDGFLMQPTCGKLQVNPGPADNPDAGYRSRIDKSTEKAEVGKYSVFMTDTQIKAELSATDRASIQAYTFPSNCKDGRILVDLYAPSEYLHNLQDAHVVKVSDTEIEGYATYFGAYTGYSAEQYYTIHFVMQFDKPFTTMGGWVNDQIKAAQEYQGAWYSTHEFETAPYKNSGWFNTDPAGIEHTGVMVAMHVASQIWGAWQSGIRDFDLNTAYEGLKKMLLTPPQQYDGGGTVGVEELVPYMKYGYIPQGMGRPSNTMEYAYDDWCLAQMANHLGHTDDYNYFLKRSANWTNLFDTETGFIRPKDKDGNWISPFDPYHTPGFTEGNAFNYTWFVPHTPEKLIALMGRDRFVSRLDSAMQKSSFANFNASGDDFANYPINHGNETSMEVAYLFNWAGAPHLTQKWVRAIQEQYYGTTPYDAYPGDEDLGQMSSWFVMSAIGLFQMDGGCSQTPVYELGSPRYPKITLNLGNKYGRGKRFVIEARNASKENKYIRSMYLNGKKVKGFKIHQKDVLKGGKLVLEMGK